MGGHASVEAGWPEDALLLFELAWCMPNGSPDACPFLGLVRGEAIWPGGPPDAAFLRDPFLGLCRGLWCWEVVLFLGLCLGDEVAFLGLCLGDEVAFLGLCRGEEVLFLGLCLGDPEFALPQQSCFETYVGLFCARGEFWLEFWLCLGSAVGRLNSCSCAFCPTDPGMGRTSAQDCTPQDLMPCFARASFSPTTLVTM